MRPILSNSVNFQAVSSQQQSNHSLAFVASKDEDDCRPLLPDGVGADNPLFGIICLLSSKNRRHGPGTSAARPPACRPSGRPTFFFYRWGKPQLTTGFLKARKKEDWKNERIPSVARASRSHDMMPPANQVRVLTSRETLEWRQLVTFARCCSMATARWRYCSCCKFVFCHRAK